MADAVADLLRGDSGGADEVHVEIVAHASVRARRCVKDFGKPVREKLSETGCVFLRHGKGDHDLWTTPSGKPIVVPIRSRHTANGILKDAGLPKAF